MNGVTMYRGLEKMSLKKLKPTGKQGQEFFTLKHNVNRVLKEKVSILYKSADYHSETHCDSGYRRM